MDDDARHWIAERGYDPKMGARPMARVLQEHVKRPLAEELLFGRLARRRKRAVLRSPPAAKGSLSTSGPRRRRSCSGRIETKE